MWLFAGALFVATFAVGLADPSDDVVETTLTPNLARMFESSTLGAFALAIGCALLAMVFALVSWDCNRREETERGTITSKIDALSVSSDARAASGDAPVREEAPAAQAKGEKEQTEATT